MPRPLSIRELAADLAPAQVWARLLDDGVYLCSISTMYRLLAVAGESRERRRQRTHPARKKPELIGVGAAVPGTGGCLRRAVTCSVA